MNDERREIALKFRVGVFVLVALAVFLGLVYALGARARLFEARYTIHADFTEVVAWSRARPSGWPACRSGA
ncbi:MAG TPA: hypothetical protein VN977_10005 [Candidatus Binatia bacterium]|nr:hypothetical protein [Candidatus Binatia bacterium]